MKRESMKITMAWLMIIFITLLFTSSARCGPSEETAACQTSTEKKLDYDNDDNYKMGLLSQESEKMSTGFGSKKLTDIEREKIERFCRFLSNESKKPLFFEQHKLVLFLLAESNFKLGKFEEAYKQYYQLKLLIKNKSDPIFEDVDQRLNESTQKAKLSRIRRAFNEKLRSDEGKIYILILVVAVLVLFMVGKGFAIWNNKIYGSNKKNNSEDKEKPPDAEPDNRGLLKLSKLYDIPYIVKNLITREQMALYDGRVSRGVLANYIEKIEMLSPDDKSKEMTDERNRAARLIVEGHSMIERLNTIAPYPIAILSNIPWLNMLPYFWQYTIIVFLFIALRATLGPLINENIYEKSVSYFLIAALIISSLTCLRIMARATINALDEMVSMLEIPKQDDPHEVPVSVWELEKNIDFLFRSPWQYFVVLLFYIIIIPFILFAGGNGFPGIAEIAIKSIFSFIILLVVCPIIWLLIGSVYVINNVSHMEDLAINPLSPLKTMGLEKWTSVISTYGLSSSIVLSFGCLIPVITHALDKTSVGIDLFWFFLIMPLLFFYWIYPYHKISSMVKQKKTERMRLVKNKIAHIFNDWKDFEDKQIGKMLRCKEKNDEDEMICFLDNRAKNLKCYLEPMNEYYEIFKKIDESPESHIKLDSILELGKALGIPSIFALLSAFLPDLLNMFH